MQDGQDGEHVAGHGEAAPDDSARLAGRLSSGVLTSSTAGTPAASPDAARLCFEQESHAITRLAAGRNWSKARAARPSFH